MASLRGMEVYMKKIAILGIVIFLVLFMVTCEEWFPDVEEVEYTDVVYSKDGSRVTVYLDGVGVPLTKEQRAMSTDLAIFAYDYLEVVFSGPTVLARAVWELGMPAGISGVERDEDYIVSGSTPAVLMVGRKEDKTLLGVGKIGDVDRQLESDYTGVNSDYPTGPGPFTEVTSTSTSVTFWVEAIKSGLEVTDDTAATRPDFNSFKNGAGLFTSTRQAWSKVTGATKYPIYNVTASTTAGSYTFYGAAADVDLKKVVKASGHAVAFRRMPRFLDGNLYRSPVSAYDFLSRVDAGANQTLDGNINNVIPLEFTIRGSGLFSFYIQMPVYAIKKTDADNVTTGNPGFKPIIWVIRTGLGSELYSLDDGFANGGCVLISTGTQGAAEWLDIYWEWMQ
jgi:hypothetical protein